MKNAAILFIIFCNMFFLLANSSKAIFAAHASSLTFVGIILNLITLIYFAPDIYRMFRGKRTLEEKSE